MNLLISGFIPITLSRSLSGAKKRSTSHDRLILVNNTVDKRGDILHTGWFRGISSVGRAFEWHSKGQRFDSAMLHHFMSWKKFFGLVDDLSFVLPNLGQIADGTCAMPFTGSQSGSE